MVTVNTWVVPSAVATVGIGVVLASTNSSSCVVHDVGPGAIRGDGELAVAVAAGHVGLWHEGGEAVDVGGVRVCRLCFAGVSPTEGNSVGASEDSGVVDTSNWILAVAQLGYRSRGGSVGEAVAQRLPGESASQGLPERGGQGAGIVATLALRGDPDFGAKIAGVC